MACPNKFILDMIPTLIDRESISSLTQIIRGEILSSNWAHHSPGKLNHRCCDV
jgi:hypothetical protein